MIRRAIGLALVDTGAILIGCGAALIAGFEPEVRDRLKSAIRFALFWGKV
ncbi:MAG TPA: hypothetical protein VGL83_08055 [Stellaceae bacterium]|jgi:hypothetical protein